MQTTHPVLPSTHGPSSGKFRTLRGSSWFLNPRHVRVSERLRTEPSNHYYGIGFRCRGINYLKLFFLTLEFLRASPVCYRF